MERHPYLVELLGCVDAEAVAACANNLLATGTPLAAFEALTLDLSRKDAKKGRVLAELLHAKAVAAGNRRAEATASLSLALCAFSRYDLGETIRRSVTAAALFAELGDKGGEGYAQNSIGRYYGACEDFPTALEHYERALELFADAGVQQGKLIALNNIGLTEYHLRNYEDGLRITEAAVEEAVAAGNVWLSVMTQSTAGVCLVALGNQRLDSDPAAARGYFERAVVHLEACVDKSRDLGLAQRTAHALIELAGAHAGLGNFPVASAYNEEGLRLARAFGRPNYIAEGLATRGWILIRASHGREGSGALKHALNYVVQQPGAKQQESHICRMLEQFYRQRGQDKVAQRYLNRALAIEEFVRQGAALRVRANREERHLLNQVSLERMRYQERLKETESALAHASRLSLAGEISAGVTHEIRQPLTAALSAIQAARRYLAAGMPNLAAADAALKLAERSVLRSNEVTAKLKAFISKHEMRRAAVNLNHVIADSLALTQWACNSHAVQVRCTLAPALPEMTGDALLLTQVMINLISNAVEAMTEAAAEERILEISAAALPPDDLIVVVIDHGRGISKELMGRLFTPFTTTRESGMGLGLSLCRTIAEAHLGRIELVRSLPGHTEFRLILPRAPGPGGSGAVAKP